MGSAFGAGAGADMLQEVLRRKFAETMARDQQRMAEAKLAEDIRQANLQHQIAQGQLGLGQQRLGLDQSQFGFRKERAGVEDQRYSEAAPLRAANLRLVGAQAGNLEGLDARTAAQRAFEEKKMGLEHGYRLGEIGAQGANALKVAGLRLRGKGGAGDDAYGDERNTRVLQSVDELEAKVSPWTTGAGTLLSYLPATDARNFAAELNTLKSNIAFNELAQMRAASKTGGALGQVSDKEGRLLESALGALDPGQSPANFKAQLQKIRGSIERWNAAKGGQVSGGSNPAGGGFRVVEIK